MNRRWMIGVALACAAGCGGFPAAKLDEAKGHVQRALDAWKSGGKPDAAKSLSPPVEFNEALWIAGEKLVSFEMGSVRYVDAAAVVQCEAKLTLRNRKGKDRTENVTYDVTLGPPVKIVNNPMP